jgi:hypothetical protein
MLDQDSLLTQACWLLVLGFALNAGYSALHFGFGFGPSYFLPGPQDRFADLIKVALSFKDYTAGLATTVEFQAWPEAYKNYLLHNPYNGAEALPTGRLTHLHHPPLSQLSFNICAILMVATKSATGVLWIWFGLYAACVAWLAATYRRCATEKRSALYPILVLCFASYPALIVFTRGNYHAGFASILISVFLVSCFGQRKVTWSAVLALALAINFRPVALIFLLAIPMILGWRRSMVPTVAAIGLALAIFLAALAAENAIYPDYGLDSFLKGLEIYKNLYIVGSWGDGGNASLWALAKNSVSMSGSASYYPEELHRVFIALALLGLFLSWRAVQQVPDLAQNGPLVLVALYVLLAPVCAEYHLLVCIAPLILLSLHQFSNPFNAILIFGSTVIILIPKNYASIEGLSIQTILNPLTLLVALLLLRPSNLKAQQKEKCA